MPLLLTNRRYAALNRHYFNACVWRKALSAAGVDLSRENGCHALRHYYASMLLDAGENIRALSEYLGHSDPAFTLRAYTHVLPTSHDRARRAIGNAFATHAAA